MLERAYIRHRLSSHSPRPMAPVDRRRGRTINNETIFSQLISMSNVYKRNAWSKINNECLKMMTREWRRADRETQHAICGRKRGTIDAAMPGSVGRVDRSPPGRCAAPPAVSASEHAGAASRSGRSTPTRTPCSTSAWEDHPANHPVCPPRKRFF